MDFISRAGPSGCGSVGLARPWPPALSTHICLDGDLTAGAVVSPSGHRAHGQSRSADPHQCRGLQVAGVMSKRVVWGMMLL
jgi:hypothetical protein